MTESNINKENSFLVYKVNVLMYVSPEATLRKDLGARSLFGAGEWGECGREKERKDSQQKFILAGDLGYVEAGPTLLEGSFQTSFLCSSSLGSTVGLAAREKPRVMGCSGRDRGVWPAPQ